MTYIWAIHFHSLLIRRITSPSIIPFMPSLRANSLTSTSCCMHQKSHFDCSTENQQVHWPPFLVLSNVEWCMHLNISGTMQSSPQKFKHIINNKAVWGCNIITNTKIITITNVNPAAYLSDTCGSTICYKQQDKYIYTALCWAWYSDACSPTLGLGCKAIIADKYDFFAARNCPDPLPPMTSCTVVHTFESLRSMQCSVIYSWR